MKTKPTVANKVMSAGGLNAMATRGNEVIVDDGRRQC